MKKRAGRAKGAQAGRHAAADQCYEEGHQAEPQEQQQQPQPMQSGGEEEEEGMEIFSARTPVRQRGSRAGVQGDSRLDQLAHQLQTPERHRGASLASWLASPTHIGSPAGLFASLEPVPLFHPSPKRAGLASPQHSGVNSFGNLFQSPVRGTADLHGSDLLGFETPSSKPHFTGLLSPSPRRSRRLASGGQQRKRAVSLEAVGWLPQLGLPGRGVDGLGDAQPFVHTTEDDEGDLVKDLLQSPGPKEVQQLAEGRPHTRSCSHLAPAAAAAEGPTAAAAAERMQAASGAVAAAAPAVTAEQLLHKPPAHPRRRALDFSKAEAMHHDLQQVLPGRRNSSRHSRSPAGLAAAEHQQHDGEQQQQQRLSLHSAFNPQLPLMPLDLSECEKHNPTINSPSTAAAAGSGVTPRRRSARQAAAFTSPRSLLEMAAAEVGGREMQALGLGLQFGLSDHPADAADAGTAVRPAFAGLGREHSSAVAGGGAGSSGGLSLMVPLGAAAAATSGSPDQPQQLQVQVQDEYMVDAEYEQQRQQVQQHPSRRQQQQQFEEDYDEDEEEQAAAAGIGGSGSKRWNLRPHGKKQYCQELQPSRRSRRIAGDTPDHEQAAAAAAAAAAGANPGSSGNSSRARSRVSRRQQQQTDDEEEEEQQEQQQQEAEIEQRRQQLLQAAQQITGQQQQQQGEEHAAEDEDAQEQQQQQQQGDVEWDEDQDTPVERPKSRGSNGRQKQKARRGKGSRGSQQQLNRHVDDTGDDGEADPVAAAAAAAAVAAEAAVAAGAADAADAEALLLQQQQQLYGLSAMPGLQLLQQGSGMQQLQLPNGLILPVGPTPDRRVTARLGGEWGLLGPGTPDEVRLAHVAHQMPPMRTCHCKKSQCLKLYCDCFASGTYCSGCACIDCRNLESNAQEVIGRRNFIQQRDPTAFTTKLAQRADTLTSRKGCKCKKSHCLKKYCECYQMGVRCGELCKCSDCQNIDFDGSGGPPNAYANKLLPRTLHRTNSSGSTRLAHTAPGAAAATAAQYWPLAGQGLPVQAGLGVSSGAATPVASMGMASQPQQTIVVRLPGTPVSTQMLCLPLHASAQGTTAAGASFQSVSGMPSVVQLQQQNSGSASIAATPNPPSKTSGLAHSREGACPTAKPLLPQFMKATAAAMHEQQQDKQMQQASAEDGSKAGAAAAAAGRGAAGDDGACLLTDEELPTPDQLAADANHNIGHFASQSPTCVTSSDAGGSGFGKPLNLSQSFAAQQQQQQGVSSSPVGTGRLAHAASGLSPVGRMSPAAAAAATAAATSSSGGPGASPRGSAGLGSVTSKGRHRLASTSRATDQAPEDQQQSQQQQQQQGLLALVSSASQQQHDVAAAAGAAYGMPQQFASSTSTRRQLLQQVKEEEDASTSCWARPQHRQQPQQPQQQQLHMPLLSTAHAAALAAPPAVHWQRNKTSAAPASSVFETPAKAQPQDGDSAAAVAGGQQDGSPVQPIILGPNGPMLVVPQRAIKSAISETAAAAAAGDESTGDGTARTAGMLMTVTDDQGNVQYYFLPAAVGAAAGGTSIQQQPHGLPELPTVAAKAEDAQQQQQPYQLRRRPASRLHGTGLPQLPATDAMVVDQQQQQECAPAVVDAERCSSKQQGVPAEAGSSGRCLRSSSSSSAAHRTPVKRSTPVKRKADVDDEGDPLPGSTAASPARQLQPSPAKLQHQLASPGQQQQHLQQQQQQHARQVVLSPVKLTRSGGLMVVQQQPQQQQQLLQLQQPWIQAASDAGSDSGFTTPMHANNAAAAAAASAADAAGRTSQTACASYQEQQQATMQLFVISAADGQQYLMQAPAGTDPSRLISADGSIDVCCLAAVLPAADALQQGGFACAPVALPASLTQQQQQQQQQQHNRLSVVTRQSSGGFSSPPPSAVRQHHVHTSPQAKVLLSPHDMRTRDGSLFKFSPGCTTVFSPNKPKLGSSPGRS